ncbi:hypothetical protein AB0I93_26780 [Streptomyces sp. NPDC049967]|uniref:hypothetical protein n=1 Tax=Streptomyces sp. NPDC049967 TaxID=3155658 RepID=UPI00344045E6
MARLQILELPTVYQRDGVEEKPFVLVIDQVDDEMADDIARWPSDISKRIGARHVICFTGTIDIPANEITLSDAADGNVVRLRVEPDLTGFTDKVMVEVASAEADAIDALRQGRR